eukprot:g28016.t1
MRRVWVAWSSKGWCGFDGFPRSGEYGLDRKKLNTFAASTILAVESANSFAAASSFFELSTSLSASASDLMAFTKSDVAWAKTRACRTISPVGHRYQFVEAVKPKSLNIFKKKIDKFLDCKGHKGSTWENVIETDDHIEQESRLEGPNGLLGPLVS